MPALPDQPNVIRADHHFTIGADSAAQCRMFLLYSGSAPSDATLTTIAGLMQADWPGAFAPYMSTDVTLTAIQLTDLSSPTSGVGENATPVPGTRVGEPMPAAACMLVNAKISRRYRGGKPRMYWPFGVAGDLTGPQTWNSGFVANIDSAIDAYGGVIRAITVAGTSIDQNVSISQYAGFTSVLNPITGRTRDVPKVRTVAIAPDVITAFAADTKLGTQRRRTLIRS